MRKTWLAVAAGFEDGGMGPPVKECGQSLEARKGKVMDSPLEPPEGNNAAMTKP